MYECVSLVKRNLNCFKKLNSERRLFNNLNKDFFEVYDKSNFAKQIFLRRTVKLLRNNFDYIGYIWTDIICKNVYNINAMNVAVAITDEKEDSKPYVYLISTIKKHCILKYLCEDNTYNSILLENIGFEKKEGTLVLFREIHGSVDLGIGENLNFEMFKKGKDEQKRCIIQNEIFHEQNRIPLILEDIYMEQLQSYYFEEGSVFLKRNKEYIGYGQIIIENDIPVIVNFGIIQKYRGRGYSKYLLSYLLNIIYQNDFHKTVIKVRNSNYKALNLYKSVGFKVRKERFNWELEK
ncbi:GNAT family N-acetyltransferase [Clostridium sp.]|jgi:ribosomal protein S18 acetylase RimI-like enzyme|uniref:GNAT family N-acetyltransferase n=1 Tax=Clostridium sp. TaxID=1506 RepID=UPI002FDCCB59